MLWKIAYLVRGRDRVCRAIAKLNRDGWSRVHCYRTHPYTQAYGRALNNQARVQGFSTLSAYVRSGSDRIYNIDSTLIGFGSPSRYAVDHWAIGSLPGSSDNDWRFYPFADPPYIEAATTTAQSQLQSYEHRDGDVLVISSSASYLAKGSGRYLLTSGAWRITSKDGNKLKVDYDQGEAGSIFLSRDSTLPAPDPGEATDWYRVIAGAIVGRGPFVDTNLWQRSSPLGAPNPTTALALLFKVTGGAGYYALSYGGHQMFNSSLNVLVHMGCPYDGVQVVVPISSNPAYDTIIDPWTNYSSSPRLLPIYNKMFKDLDFEYIAVTSFASGWNYNASRNVVWTPYYGGVILPAGWGSIRGGEEIEVIAGTDVEGVLLPTGLKSVVDAYAGTIPGESYRVAMQLDKPIHNKDIKDKSLGITLVRKIVGTRGTIRATSGTGSHELRDRGQNVVSFGPLIANVPEGTLIVKRGTGVTTGVSSNIFQLVAPTPSQKGSGGAGMFTVKAVADMQKFFFAREPFSFKLGQVSYGCSQEFLCRVVKEAEGIARVESQAPIFKTYTRSALDICYIETFINVTGTLDGRLDGETTTTSGFILEKVSDNALRVQCPTSWIVGAKTTFDYTVRINKRGALKATTAIAYNTHGYVSMSRNSWGPSLHWTGPMADAVIYVPPVRTGAYDGFKRDLLVDTSNRLNQAPPMDVIGEYKFLRVSTFIYVGFEIHPGVLWQGDPTDLQYASNGLIANNFARIDLIDGAFGVRQNVPNQGSITAMRLNNWKPFLIVNLFDTQGKALDDPTLAVNFKGFPTVAGGLATLRINWRQDKADGVAAVVAPPVNVNVVEGKAFFSYPGWYYEPGWMLCINEKTYVINSDKMLTPTLEDGSYSGRLFWRPTRRGIRGFTRPMYMNPYEWRDRIRSIKCTFSLSGSIKIVETGLFGSPVYTINLLGSQLSGVYDCVRSELKPDQPYDKTITSGNFTIKVSGVLDEKLRAGLVYVIEHTADNKDVASGSFFMERAVFPEDVRDLSGRSVPYLRGSDPTHSGFSSYNQFYHPMFMETFTLAGMVQVSPSNITRKRYL